MAIDYLMGIFLVLAGLWSIFKGQFSWGLGSHGRISIELIDITARIFGVVSLIGSVVIYYPLIRGITYAQSTTTIIGVFIAAVGLLIATIIQIAIQIGESMQQKQKKKR